MCCYTYELVIEYLNAVNLFDKGVIRAQFRRISDNIQSGVLPSGLSLFAFVSASASLLICRFDLNFIICLFNFGVDNHNPQKVNHICFGNKQVFPPVPVKVWPFI